MRLNIVSHVIDFIIDDDPAAVLFVVGGDFLHRNEVSILLILGALCLGSELFLLCLEHQTILLIIGGSFDLSD